MADFSAENVPPTASDLTVEDAPKDTKVAEFLKFAQGGDTFLFKMRGVDDGRAPPGYISWVATFPDFLGTQVAGAVPPLIGSLVPGSVVEIARWIDQT